MFTAPLNAHSQFCWMGPSFVVCMKKNAFQNSFSQGAAKHFTIIGINCCPDFGALSWDNDIFGSFSGCWAFGPGSSAERAVGWGSWSPRSTRHFLFWAWESTSFHFSTSSRSHKRGTNVFKSEKNHKKSSFNKRVQSVKRLLSVQISQTNLAFNRQEWTTF